SPRRPASARSDARSLSGQQPPPARLSAVGELELDAVGGERLDARIVQRRARPGDDGDELGVSAERLEDGAERRLGLAPGEDLLVDEPDRVTDREAPGR